MSAVLSQQQKKEWTIEEFYLSPFSQNHELVEGELIPVMPTGFLHGIVTNRISAALTGFVDENNLGVVLAAETGFIVYQENHCLRQSV